MTNETKASLWDIICETSINAANSGCDGATMGGATIRAITDWLVPEEPVPHGAKLGSPGLTDQEALTLARQHFRSLLLLEAMYTERRS